jgi:hypothetical protein
VVASRKTALRELKGKPTSTVKKSASKLPTDAKLEEVITVDRRASRERRQATDRRVETEPVAVERRVMQRREKVCRRRQIDPTTCERDYTPEEIEFMSAMDGYKRSSGRMFPTCSEVLEVLKSLGYEKRSESAPAAVAVVDMSLVSPPSPTVVG